MSLRYVEAVSFNVTRVNVPHGLTPEEASWRRDFSQLRRRAIAPESRQVSLNPGFEHMRSEADNRRLRAVGL